MKKLSGVALLFSVFCFLLSVQARTFPFAFFGGGKPAPVFGASFTPADLGTNILLWAEARFLNGYADGATVTNWTDLSPWAHHLTNTAAGPLYSTTNAAKPHCYFPGTDGLLSAAPFLGKRHAFLVFQRFTPISGAVLFYGTTNSLHFQCAVGNYGDDSIDIYAGADVVAFSDDAFVSWQIAALTWDGTNSRVNLVGHDDVVADAGTITFDSVTLAPGTPLNVRAFLVVNETLTAANYTNLIQYLQARVL